MKKLLLLLTLTPYFLLAGGDYKAVIEVQLTESSLDPTLKGNSAMYVFQFEHGETALPEENVLYSIDGKNGEQQSKNGQITIKTVAGNHIFQFYYNDQYLEVFSDSLLIKAKYRDTYTVNLKRPEVHMQHVVYKPVIYLYPEAATKVNVEIDIHGDHPFYYPAYDESWDFTAQPNGDLIFGDETYNYLFWESTRRAILSPKQTATGFFVAGDNTIEFLEEQLTNIGFNSKERADFITFWGPRLALNKLNFIHFEFNDECTRYADLSIQPKPDNVYRLFMTWGAVSEKFDAKEQEMKTFDRSGFSVLEWGGQESHIRQSVFNTNN